MFLNFLQCRGQPRANKAPKTKVPNDGLKFLPFTWIFFFFLSFTQTYSGSKGITVSTTDFQLVQ